jgi:tripartite-type tricarboxylate transporter receptor subunit TctC
MRRLTAALAVLGAGLGLAATGIVASAQTFPDKPIRLILPLQQGGQADLLARLVTEKAMATLGQPFIIDPRPGAAGNLAYDAGAKAAPDGYTLVYGTPGLALNGSLFKSLSYKPTEDLVPITLLASGPFVLYVSGKLPVSNFAELVAYAKANPGKLNYGSVGTTTQLAGALLADAAKIDMVHVPYKGFPAALTDIISGDVHMIFNGVGTADQFLKTGELKLLAVSSPARVKAYPDVPAIAETYAGFDVRGWYGFEAPAGVPQDRLDKLNAALTAALRQPEIVEKIESFGLVPGPQTLAEAKRFLLDDAAKWARAVKLAGIQPE